MGAEMMPFQNVLKFIKNFKVDLAGGITWYGTQPEASVLKNDIKNINVAALICWESVFGEYFTKFINQNAELLFIITNDGWWGDTNGHKRHLRFAQIRAIETRRSIARCANTGISAIINQKGQVISKTNYWQQNEISANINLNNKLTFYTKYGDWLGKISAFIAVFIILFVFVKNVKSTKT
jgi:apolipoprotein N-acyltransferase